MDALFITGTAGSGKSLLSARLLQWYKENPSFPVSLNLDPGAINLPYEPDVDIRDYQGLNGKLQPWTKRVASHGK